LLAEQARRALNWEPGQKYFSLNPSLNLCLPRVFGVVNPVKITLLFIVAGKASLWRYISIFLIP
ncbi:hypothetical protein, partial [Desulfonatronospira sp.]|uniref:hypothetical protein n=1 Tax=Desulfonatronospira sp. TaxID=1962951 RepID=UPI0025C55331